MSDKKSAGGLADIIAGETAIATVGKEGAGLTYRGSAWPAGRPFRRYGPHRCPRG